MAELIPLPTKRGDSGRRPPDDTGKGPAKVLRYPVRYRAPEEKIGIDLDELDLPVYGRKAPDPDADDE